MPEFIGSNMWPEFARKELLHLLPQSGNHAQAEIRGSPQALARLGRALLKASRLGQTEHVEIRMMASDGEGYPVMIRPMSDEQMAAGPLPYAQLGQTWEFGRCWDCPKRKGCIPLKQVRLDVEATVQAIAPVISF